MANTYTYTQLPSHGGPQCATGKVVVDTGLTDGAQDANVECGFHPSLVIVAKDSGDDETPIDLIAIWSQNMGAAWFFCADSAVMAAASTPIYLYTGSDLVNNEKLGFTLGATSLLAHGDDIIYWIAFP